jgi:hypothetical protein
VKNSARADLQSVRRLEKIKDMTYKSMNNEKRNNARIANPRERRITCDFMKVFKMW